MRKIIIEVPSNCLKCNFHEIGDCMAFVDKDGCAIRVLKSNRPHQLCRAATVNKSA